MGVKVGDRIRFNLYIQNLYMQLIKKYNVYATRMGYPLL